MKPILIVIVGPTGVGKTNLSIAVARHFNTHIISADSRQVYTEPVIGTAQPSQTEQQMVPHHMIGTRSITDYYNASMFEQEVHSQLDKLFISHKVVLMTGGSGLYIDAVIEGIDELPTISPQVRRQVLHNFEIHGLDWLRSEVQRIDPDYYGKVDINNPKRMLKALEIFEITGKPYSDFLTAPKKERVFQTIKIGLNMEREKLYQRINNRVDLMIEAGLEDEARKLLPHKNLNALNTVGYRELFAYFNGNISKLDAIEKIKANTRKYARRQLTWFRRDSKIKWFHPDDQLKIIQYLEPLVSQS